MSPLGRGPPTTHLIRRLRGLRRAAKLDNAAGIAALHYATGPEAAWNPHQADGQVNNSASTEYYMRGMSPGPQPLPGEDQSNASFYFGGTVVNEWNPTPCLPRKFEKWWLPGIPEAGGQDNWCNNSAAAVAGYTLSRLKWPNTFSAAWVAGGASEDVQFQSMMLDGVLDLAVIE